MTPRRTRLVRVPTLRGFRQAIASIVGSSEVRDFGETLIVVATRAATRYVGAGLAVTRDELYEQLHARLPNPPRRLAPIERDVLAQAAARLAADRTPPSFQLRPGLVAEMLCFYDHLRRQSQQIDRFEQLILDALGSSELEDAADRLRHQTCFLADTFLEYERRVAASGCCDEHVLRERLIAEAPARPVRHVVVTTADWIADRDGLYIADFDLLARLPGLERLDLIATERLLGAGFHERLHRWWPGLEEREGNDERHMGASQADPPSLVVPAGGSEDELWWTRRDREEELVAVARQLKADRRRGDAVPLDRTAVVFKPPLPYLYLAAEVFSSAGISFQAADGLPLAAEPTAAALDLVLETVASNFTRDSLVALLRSPHFVFEREGRQLTGADASALSRELCRARYLGDFERLSAVATSLPALAGAVTVARELAPLTKPAPASVQLGRALAFWQAHLRPIAGVDLKTAGRTGDDPLVLRERRARIAITDTLNALASAHATYDDPPWTIEDVALAIRRSIEDQTFDPDPSHVGVQLVDDRAARYGEFDDVTIVGVVETDWPDRTRRNIFYPPALLKSLGWPSEKDRRAADDAQFLDLLACASRRTLVSVFTLDEDALVSRSVLLDQVPQAKLRVMTRARTDGEEARIFVDEALSLDPCTQAPLEARSREWAELRAARSPADAPRFHGCVGAAPPTAWSVSALETYLECPFKFFARQVLELEEELDDEEVMGPKRQGRLMHQIFESFFNEWQASGRSSIEPSSLDEARALFAEIIDRTFETVKLSETEAALERTRLVGSAVAAGLGEAVMRMEAERPTRVVERLVEYSLNGAFTFSTRLGPRTVALGAKADRLDLLEDGGFRLIDYKLGWPPDKSRALQLPIYAICAEQELARSRGRRFTLDEAAYLAFKGPKRVVALFRNAADRDEVLIKASERLVTTVDRIAAGEFPPTPDDVYRCESCDFASVCRKDYVGDV